MRRLVVVLVCMAACSAPTTPDGPQQQSSIRVSPRSATIDVGQMEPLSAATLDAAGDSTGIAAVTWSSSASSIASVSRDGVATGLAPGVTTVVAATSDGTRDSAQITVVADACNGIAHVAHLQGAATLTFTYSALLGSVQYVANNSATMNFTADAKGSGPNGQLLWIGSATGTGSEHETRTDHESDQVETLAGDGALVVSDINLSHVFVFVDLSTCRYTLEGVPYIDVTESPEPGDLGASWIGWFRTAPTLLAPGTGSGSLAMHSVTWLGPNYLAATGWYVPLGFSSDYFGDGAPDDGSAGTATVNYSISRAP